MPWGAEPIGPDRCSSVSAVDVTSPSTRSTVVEAGGAKLAPVVNRSSDRLGLGWAIAITIALFGATIVLLVKPILMIPLLAVPLTVAALWLSRRDAVSVLTIFLFFLIAIPANLVLGPMGASGRPCLVFGLLCGAWWFFDRLLPESQVARGAQPVRTFGLLLLAAMVASYAAAFARPLDGLEASAANRGALAYLGLIGILLLAVDGITDRARLDTLLRRLSFGGAVLATIGLLQFIGIDVSGAFDLPLLTDHAGFQEVQIRSGLRRVAGTTAHPIEFGVVLALVFPIAVHYAVFARRLRVLAWLPVLLISMAIPMAVSRSGTLALAITFGAIWVTWPNRRRVISIVVAVFVASAMRFVIPGLLGTIRSLFTNLGTDDSIAGRTSDYEMVGSFLSKSPIVGRGVGTLLPDRYILLDNQYLGTLIEMGIFGTIVLVGLFVVGFFCARGARRGADEETRSLGQALAGSVLATAVTAGTFDLLGFTMVAGLSMLLLGCAGALWRLQRPVREVAPRPTFVEMALS